MEVFISWSGEPSHQLALILKEWVSCVIQIIDPWVSSEDIEKGDRWSNEIAEKLDSCNIGIICLTKDNFQAPWINFEAGALSKKLGIGKVCTLLLDLKPTDIKGPLTQFQATSASNKEDMKKLIKTINESLQDNKVKDDTLNKTFEIWWESYNQNINTIRQISSTALKGEKVRTNEDLSEEILFGVREILKYEQRKESDKFDYMNKLNVTIEELLIENSKMKMLLEQRDEALRNLDIQKIPEIAKQLQNSLLDKKNGKRI